MHCAAKPRPPPTNSDVKPMVATVLTIEFKMKQNRSLIGFAASNLFSTVRDTGTAIHSLLLLLFLLLLRITHDDFLRCSKIPVAVP